MYSIAILRLSVVSLQPSSASSQPFKHLSVRRKPIITPIDIPRPKNKTTNTVLKIINNSIFASISPAYRVGMADWGFYRKMNKNAAYPPNFQFFRGICCEQQDKPLTLLFKKPMVSTSCSSVKSLSVQFLKYHLWLSFHPHFVVVVDNSVDKFF